MLLPSSSSAQAARERNGIYLSPDSWTDLASTHEARRLALEEAQRTSDLYDMQLRTTREQFEHSLRLIGTREAELEGLMTTLDQTNADLALRSAELDVTRREAADEGVLRRAHDSGRQEWRKVAGKAIDDTEGLRAKIGARLSDLLGASNLVARTARKHAVEMANLGAAAEAEATFGATTTSLRSQIAAYEAQHRQYTAALRSAVSDASARATEASTAERRRLAKGKGRLEEASLDLGGHVATFAASSTGYAEAVDASRSAYLGDARERAEEFRATCEGSVEGLLGDWDQVLTQVRARPPLSCSPIDTHAQSLSAIKQVAELLEATHTSAIEQLGKNVATLEARREAERVHLESEVRPCRCCVDSLADRGLHRTIGLQRRTRRSPLSWPNSKARRRRLSSHCSLRSQRKSRPSAIRRRPRAKRVSTTSASPQKPHTRPPGRLRYGEPKRMRP
jgi:kinesin family protein 11